MDAAEANLQAAMQSYKQHLSNDILESQSLQDTAEKFNVNRQTLANRLQGISRPRTVAYTHLQHLTPSEEDVLVSWILRQQRIGQPLTPGEIRQVATTIQHQRHLIDHPDAAEPTKFSKAWISYFKKRHPEVHTVRTRSLERTRYIAVTRETFESFFAELKPLVDRHKYPVSSIFNMDETGFSIGSSVNKQVMVVRDQAEGESRKKQPGRATKVDGGRQEWLTSIECIAADGTSLPPTIIFKGEGVVQDRWMPRNLPEAAQWHWVASKSGWTSDDVGYEWLRSHFHPLTRPPNPSSHRLLFVDGHASHVTARFMGFCLHHHIDLFILPAHTSHLSQPLDIACFGPYKRLMGLEADRTQRLLPGRVGKSDFATCIGETRRKALTEDNIRSGFKASGLYPFRPETLYRRLPNPSTPPLQASQNLSRTPMASLTLENQDFIAQHEAEMNTPVKDRVKLLSETVERLAAEKAALEAENKEMREARAEERRPRAGMTTTYQGTFFFSTEDMVRKRKAMDEASSAKKRRKGKGKAPADREEPSVPVHTIMD